MKDVYTYAVDLPPSVREMVVPTDDGYTVYTNSRHSIEAQREALRHAEKHIRRNDWEKEDARQIETEVHHAD